MLLLIGVLSGASPGAAAPPPPLTAIDSAAEITALADSGRSELSADPLRRPCYRLVWYHAGITLTRRLFACPACGFLPLVSAWLEITAAMSPWPSSGPDHPLSRWRGPRFSGSPQGPPPGQIRGLNVAMLRPYFSPSVLRMHWQASPPLRRISMKSPFAQLTMWTSSLQHSRFTYRGSGRAHKNKNKKIYYVYIKLYNIILLAINGHKCRRGQSG